MPELKSGKTVYIKLAQILFCLEELDPEEIWEVLSLRVTPTKG